MTFDEYFSSRVGKGIDFDGNYGVQCFDLANDFSVKVVGGKQFIGMGAYEIYTNFYNQPGHDLYTRIANTPDFVPKKGDIIVWGQGLGRWGHVAICNGKGTTDWFESYDQNWTGRNDPVTLIRHNYNNVLGVLRAKDQTKINGKPAPKPKKKKGDVNGDDKINVSDITAVSSHIKGIKALTKEQKERANVNNDGKVDVSDIATISAHIKGIKPIADTAVYHTVSSGETLLSIAKKYGVSVITIANLNNINDVNKIYPGQKLKIKE